MKKYLLGLSITSAFLLAACGGDNADTNTETPADSGETASVEAEAVVNQKCISCHGGNLEGQGNAPALNDVGSRLSEQEILTVILEGKGGMPGGIIQGAEAEAVAAWLAEMK
ncbi:cytochrome c551 [Chryseomicrobium palamuruense]|uniref:Cytochrome c551 n=1 Tax=Chryseomicrobium palamuruense TaxID=682973 RepID=A0ABV8UQN2_9BACL